MAFIHNPPIRPNCMSSMTAVILMCARVAALLLTRPSIISSVRFSTSSYTPGGRARSIMTYAVTGAQLWIACDRGRLHEFSKRSYFERSSNPGCCQRSLRNSSAQRIESRGTISSRGPASQRGPSLPSEVSFRVFHNARFFRSQKSFICPTQTTLHANLAERL